MLAPTCAARKWSIARAILNHNPPLVQPISTQPSQQWLQGPLINASIDDSGRISAGPATPWIGTEVRQSHVIAVPLAVDSSGSPHESGTADGRRLPIGFRRMGGPPVLARRLSDRLLECGIEVLVRGVSNLVGLDAYFQMPSAEEPTCVEFRIGNDEDEFGIIDRAYTPAAMQPDPGGAILHWHVDDLEGTFAHLQDLGATIYEPITPRSGGFTTASVVDPFGNIIGILTNPHLAGPTRAA